LGSLPSAVDGTRRSLKKPPPEILEGVHREQIQFAGAILPHGVLPVLREPECTIVQAGQNTGTLFGIEAKALLGNTLQGLLGVDQVVGITEKLRADPLPGPPTRIATVSMHGAAWNVLAHRYDQVVFLEFEPGSNRGPTFRARSLFTTSAGHFKTSQRRIKPGISGYRGQPDSGLHGL
jgi:light-regulated signal transduction histidine kinase (bacteriophytochrome)